MRWLRVASLTMLSIALATGGGEPASVSLSGADEVYRSYPKPLASLHGEQVIIIRDEAGTIEKVYWYDEKGRLERISWPQQRTILWLYFSGSKWYYSVSEVNGTFGKGLSSYSAVGGDFGKFNWGYRGGAGLADAGLDEGRAANIVDGTERSVANLRSAIAEYQTHTGKPLTAAELMQPVDMNHPLMREIETLGLQDFLDAFGERLQYKPTPSGWLAITSTNLEMARLTVEGYEESRRALGSQIVVAYIALLVVLLVVLVVVGVGVVWLLRNILRAVFRNT